MASWTTLDEARAFVRAGWGKGVECPCCGRFVKLYKRVMSSSMAYALILIDRHFRQSSEWLHVQSYIVDLPDLNPKARAAVRGDFAKLSYWGLLCEHPKVELGGRRKNASPPSSERPKRPVKPPPRSGLWRITHKGRQFVDGVIRVPSHALVYKRVARGFSEETVSIREALGERFDYDELMKAVVVPDGLSMGQPLLPFWGDD
jgi:hypothetical protein